MEKDLLKIVERLRARYSWAKRFRFWYNNGVLFGQEFVNNTFVGFVFRIDLDKNELIPVL